MSNNKFLNQSGISHLWTKIKANFLGKDEAYSKQEVDAHTSNSDIHLTATDRTKLNGIADNANNYVHPTESGYKHIPSGGSSGQILRWSADGTAEWGSDNTLGSFGITATKEELNYTDGVTSNIQTQLDGKVSKSGDTMSGRLTLNVSNNEVSPNKQSLVINGIETTDVALCPGIGMHIPNKTYGSLKLREDGSWRFYDNACSSFMPVYASTFHGNLNGNATSATKATQDGSGNIITSTYAPISLVNRVTTLEDWKATFGGLTFKKESNGSVTISVV